MLSVIIPLYNAEKSIEDCLRSVLQQTYNDLEIIIVDDGSQDKSYEICERFNDKRIRLYRQKNGGVSKARNLGIDKATGEYITFLDADDWIEEQTYEKMIAEFNNPTVDIVIGGFVRERNGVVIPILEKESEVVMRSGQAITELLRNRIFRGELWDKVYRRTLFKELRLDEDIAIAEDLLINWQLFHRATNICYLPVWGYHYVINEDSVCHHYTRKSLTHIKAIEKIISMPDKSDYINHIIMGIYARALASNILKMLITRDKNYGNDIMNCQSKLRKIINNSLFAPYLSLRQRLGIIYAVLPIKICAKLSDIASLGQRNL